MKKQKRYTTRKQITDAIDASHEQLAEVIAFANSEDVAAKRDSKAAALATIAGDRAHLEEQARWHISERERLFRAADRIEKIKIPRLGRTLAAYDTQPMGALGLKDAAVVLQ